MIRLLKTSLLLVGISFVGVSIAQNDFNAWAGVDIRVPVTKKLNVGVKLESRFENNISKVEQTFVAPYLKLDLHNHIEMGLVYRFSNRPESGLFGSQNVHRFGWI